MASSSETVCESAAAMVEMRQELERAWREVERARMGAEDVRAAAIAASISPYPMYQLGDPRYRLLTWREFAEKGVRLSEELLENRDTARDTLERACVEVRQSLDEPTVSHRDALIAARGSMEDAFRQLDPDNSDDAMESDVDSAIKSDVDSAMESDAGDAGDVDSAMESTGVGSVDEGHSSVDEGHSSAE